MVAEVLSRRLGYRVSVADCGFSDRAQDGDTFDGLRTAVTFGGTIATVAELSGRDLSRRNFMLGSTFAAAAFAEPAWMAMTSGPARDLAEGGRIGRTDVEILRSTVRHFERLHRVHGGGRVRPQVVQLVHQHSRAIRDGNYGEAVGRDFAGALAEATFLAGLATVDSGRHALGQRYFAQALGLAMRAGDQSFGANVLAEMSVLTIDIGANSVDQREAGQAGQHAVSLARSAQHVIGGRATPAVSAYLHAVEARSLSLLGDRQSSAVALDAAKRAFDRGPCDEPGWLSHYSEVDFTSDIGQCLRDIGRPQQGIALLERAVADLPAGRVTSQVKTRIHIATAFLELGEHDQAGRITGEVINAMEGVASERIAERMKRLRKRAQQCGATQVDERLA
ncbi:hypothetical protein [Alloactinosynnema sp. L-07]|uniref:hypothetical protein n=1 Tax=Alloactinosynnema sp. L-07 TaxID=1653480 RepID=UPI001E63DB3A|nr:hypothetical protein [Alloactinosynnema sp. L-07]